MSSKIQTNRKEEAMGLQWARCKVCGEKFYASYDPRFDSGREILRVMLVHFRKAHPQSLEEFLDEFPEMREWNEWLNQHPEEWA
jgi:NAD-dependent SIR2 family protein deacetylase